MLYLNASLFEVDDDAASFGHELVHFDTGHRQHDLGRSGRLRVRILVAQVDHSPDAGL